MLFKILINQGWGWGHTIAVIKMVSRRVVDLGARLLILISFVDKVGAILVSISSVMVASLLCFMWAILTTFGLSKI